MRAVKKSSAITRKDMIGKHKEKKTNLNCRWINISMFFCLSIPLVFLICLYSISLISGRGVFDPILMNSKITLAFIISMLGIFCGYICNRSVKALKDKKDINSVKRNLIIIAISQGLVVNIFGLVLVVFAIIKTFKIKSLKDINIKEIFIDSKITLDFIFSLFILFVAFMCLILIINIY
ncbi:MAG: hypothetical protein Q4B63_08530 [Clostridium perfringens]|nr:hypothetical protein [Clostridium perfringens]